MIAYHGTSKEFGEEIKNGGSYKLSLGEFEWLGCGVYFFVDSIYSKSPIEDARSWARLQAYDKQTKRYTYNRYTVIKNSIEGQVKLWDLSSQIGAEIFISIKEQALAQFYKAGKRLKGPPIDGYVIEFAQKKIRIFNFNVVKNDIFIKLTKEERIWDIRSLQPNCTVLAVRDTALIKIKDICEEGNCDE